jgi:hypothetical protein
MRTEKGGSVSQDKCIYIGHTTAARAKLGVVFWSACVRQLFLKCGNPFASFKEQVSKTSSTDTGVVKVEYSFTDDQTTFGELNVTVAASATFETVANDIETAWAAATVSTSYSVRLHALRYVPVTDAAGSVDSMEFKLNMRGSTFTFSASSNMKIQNRTLAATGAGDTEHQHHVTSVENNPLQGKSYYKMGNGFRYKWTNDSTNATNFMGDDASGLIEADPDEATLSTELQDLLQRPPAGTQFYHCKHSGHVKLGPGQIKSSNLKYVKTMTCDSFLNAMLPEYEAAAHHFFPYGKARMFALEKMMHTDDGDEPDMAIGYEINNFYQGYISTKIPSITVDKDVL